MAANNLFLNTLTTLGYQQGVQRVPLQTGVNLHALRFRLTADLTVAGGAADGTVQSDAIQRLISSVYVSHDGVNIVQPINGRTLFNMMRWGSASIATPLQPAGAGVQAATALAFDGVIWFARPWLANPIMTAWPGTVPVNQELALYVQFDNSASNAASGPGTGAIISGGDRTVTLANVQLSVTQEYSSAAIRPWYLPQITVRQTEQYAAANEQLPLLLTGGARFDSVLFSTLVDVTQETTQAPTLIRLIAAGGSVRFLNNVPWQVMRSRDGGTAPARFVEPTAAGAATYQFDRIGGGEGRMFWLAADNGLLGNAFNPRPLSDPRFEFAVPAPTGGVGFVQGVFFELLTRPPFTRVE